MAEKNNKNSKSEILSFNKSNTNSKDNSIPISIIVAGIIIAIAIISTSSSVQFSYFAQSNFDNLTLDVNVTNNQSNPSNVVVTDPETGTEMGVDTNGRGDVTQHAHPFQISSHFHVESLSAGVYRYIIASSNLTPFFNNQSIEYLHVEWIEIQVDSDVNGAYAINLGFIENVTNISSNRYIVKHFDGSKSTGQQLLEFANFYPNGWRMSSDKVITHGISLNDTGYNTLTPLPSVYDPNNATITPHNNDIILEINVTGGEINVAFDTGYHPDSTGTD